jgi:hypothetical protein
MKGTANYRAVFYAVWLRAAGYTPKEAARLVVERYPAMRRQLRELLRREKEANFEAMQERTQEPIRNGARSAEMPSKRLRERR